MRVLDLACGTGDITYALADAGASSVGLDITARMVEIARAKRPSAAKPGFLVGDMMALPFGDATFDVVTTGYGIRNVPVIAEAVAEMARVLRPGGVLLSLDFDRPANPLIRAAYLGYLTVVGSTLGLVLHGDPDTYRYIPESIRRYPGADGVCAHRAGARVCRLRALSRPRRPHGAPPRGQIAHRFTHRQSRKPLHFRDDSVTINWFEDSCAFVSRQPPRHGATD